MQNPTEILQRSLELPCGAVLKNRIVKSPMSDSLGDGRGNPTKAQMRLYERWALGGAALSVIGEVQPDPRYPEKPGNLVLGEDSDREKLKELTGRAAVTEAHLWAQLGNAGALSYTLVSEPKGPSPLDIPGLKCETLSLKEIQEIPGRIAAAALTAKGSGFTGVMIHGGHGFLLSQFLSPLFNRRQDQYGGSVKGRSRLLMEVLESVRAAVGPSFPVGIRINATDKLEGGLTGIEALQVISLLDQTPTDLIDISGGTYFPGAKSSSDGNRRGPYFLDFARKAKEITRIPLVLTGGFKKRVQALQVLSEGAADMVGIARAMVLDPELPRRWFEEAGGDPTFPRFENPRPGEITAWYTLRLRALGENREKDFSMGLPEALREYEKRDRDRAVSWKEQFLTRGS